MATTIAPTALTITVAVLLKNVTLAGEAATDKCSTCGNWYCSACINEHVNNCPEITIRICAYSGCEEIEGESLKGEGCEYNGEWYCQDHMPKLCAADGCTEQVSNNALECIRCGKKYCGLHEAAYFGMSDDTCLECQNI